MARHIGKLGPNCEKCGLHRTCGGPVVDDGGDYTILVVGEAPGEEEDEAGIPFVGRSGTLLRTTLTSLGFPKDKVTYTNVVRCRPPDNKISRTHIKNCYTSLPIKDNTEIVILLGNTPLNAVLGESRISEWNGVLVEKDGITYVPAYHPAYILRNNTMSGEWVDALDSALSAYHGVVEKAADAHYEYLYPIKDKDVERMCVELMTSDVIAFDTEFCSLDPYDPDNRILCVSFATADKAWAVSIDHPGDLARASDEQIDMICNVLEAHPCIVGHNIKMDQMMMNVILGCDFDAHGDSMILSFLVKSIRGIHGLKRLAGYYLGMYEYESELTDYTSEHAEADFSRGGSYANVPLNILIHYAAMDAAATYLLHERLLDEVTDKQRTFYDEIAIPVSNTLYRLQVNGMAVDKEVAERYRRLYTYAIDARLDRILEDRMVRRYVKAVKSKLTGVKRDRYVFNPGSWQQKAVVLYGTDRCNWLHEPKYKGKWEHYEGRYYNLEPLGETDTGNPSTKRENLEPLKDKCPLVEDLYMYNMYSTILSTFILPVADPDNNSMSADGRARSSFNQHVVETGRLSSSSFKKGLGFNHQNIPAPEKEPGTILEYQPVKNLFTHTFEGGCLLCADYSGMELRVFASLAKCYPMIEIHASGLDFHTMVGVMVSGKKYEDITRQERYRYKWTNWTILYGGGAYTLWRLYGIPKDEGEEVMRTYFSRFPQVPEYVEECIQFARVHGYIETPFGNRRPLPNISDNDMGRRSKAEREAINTPVQGGAGIITVSALAIIDMKMREAEFKSMLVNTVHDSIVTDIYPGELDAVAEMQADVMENIVDYMKEYMPSIDMSWMICPLKADLEFGSNYGTLEHYVRRK